MGLSIRRLATLAVVTLALVGTSRSEARDHGATEPPPKGLGERCHGRTLWFLKAVRIVPDYTPLKYSEGGRTRYGVESVCFRVAGAKGTVDADGPIDLSSGPTSDLVNVAAAAAPQRYRY